MIAAHIRNINLGSFLGGINYELNADCETTKAYKSFWASVSVHIARSVPGEIVFWLASGDRPFDNNARFTKHEIPNLPQKVSELVVIILCNGGKWKKL